jgi:hypothetical protein
VDSGPVIVGRQAAVARARRPGVVGGVVVAVIVAAFTAAATSILAVVSTLAILAGVAFCLTLVGAVVGIPMVLLGLLGIVGAAVGGAGGVFFAVVLGAGVGFVFYRHRSRRLRGRRM